MERRSFLRGLLLAPVAAPFIAAKAYAEPETTSFTLTVDRFRVECSADAEHVKQMNDEHRRFIIETVRSAQRTRLLK